MNLTDTEKLKMLPPANYSDAMAVKAWMAMKLMWEAGDILNDGPDDSDRDQAMRYAQEGMKIAREAIAMVDPVTAADMGSCPRAFKGKLGHFAWTSDFDVETRCECCGCIHWRNEKLGTAGTVEVKHG